MTDPQLASASAPLASGERRAVMVEGRSVVLFQVDGRTYAVGDRCPHRGGPLSRGRVEPGPDGGPAVRCPLHGWLFDLATGRCLNQPEAGTPVYAVACRDGALCVTR